MKHCVVAGCERPYRCSGYCAPHYRRFKRVGTPDGLAPRTRLGDRCVAPGCDRAPVAVNLCAGHYQQRDRGEDLRPLRPIRQPNVVVVEEGIAWIVLTGQHGEEVARTCVDVDDLPIVRAHRWRVTRGSDPGAKPYVVAHDAGLLHRLLLGAPRGHEVDHVDRDGLNNRRTNLRIVTRAQNAQNVQRDGRALPRNVYPNGPHHYAARVTVGGVKHHGGTYATVEEAAEVAQVMRSRLLTHAV